MLTAHTSIQEFTTLSYGYVCDIFAGSKAEPQLPGSMQLKLSRIFKWKRIPIGKYNLVEIKIFHENMSIWEDWLFVFWGGEGGWLVFQSRESKF